MIDETHETRGGGGGLLMEGPAGLGRQDRPDIEADRAEVTTKPQPSASIHITCEHHLASSYDFISPIFIATLLPCIVCVLGMSRHGLTYPGLGWPGAGAPCCCCGGGPPGGGAPPGGAPPGGAPPWGGPAAAILEASCPAESQSISNQSHLVGSLEEAKPQRG